MTASTSPTSSGSSARGDLVEQHHLGRQRERPGDGDALLLPPFDNPDLRQAMALSFDRQAFVDIVTEGHGDIGGVMQPPPEGLGACRPRS